jgi:hypothetical protein
MEDRFAATHTDFLCPWNVHVYDAADRENARWVAQLRDRIELHEEDTPQFRHNLWRQTFDTPSYQRLFRPHEEKIWSYQLPANAEIVIERACSKSYIAVQGDVMKARVVSDIKEILDKGEDKVWIDESQGIFEYPYQTLLVVAERK